MIRNYIKAARLRTLPLSISGIILGNLLAKSQGFFDWTIFTLSILTTIGFQVLSNFANDYGDGVKGTDSTRIGEKRMVGSGKLSPSQMKLAIILTTTITFNLSLFLIYHSFGMSHLGYSIVFFILGISSIVAAIKYTVGKTAYGYSGFGDLFVFVFFGLLSVVGSNFLVTKTMDFTIFLPAFSIGLLSTAVLNLNNMRDYENDKQSGKYTIVVKIGRSSARKYHYILLVLSLLFAIGYVFISYDKIIQFLFLFYKTRCCLLKDFYSYLILPEIQLRQQ